MLETFTLFHVILSLLGIVSGFVVIFGLIGSKRMDVWTAWFVATTALTSVTGFLFPFRGFLPSYAVGAISLVVLAVGVAARYRFQLAGGWRVTYVISAVLALYLNFFVLIVQLFRKVPALDTLAPTQSEPPFQITQLVVLLFFAVLGFRAAVKFHGEPLQTA